MLYLIVSWFLSALSLIIVAHVVPGFHVQSFGTALIASIVIGLINATLGLLLKILTLPLTIVTFGIFLVIMRSSCARRDWEHSASTASSRRYRRDRAALSARSCATVFA
jgi:putative membrane protein